MATTNWDAIINKDMINFEINNINNFNNVLDCREKMS